MAHKHKAMTKGEPWCPSKLEEHYVTRFCWVLEVVDNSRLWNWNLGKPAFLEAGPDNIAYRIDTNRRALAILSGSLSACLSFI
jgi:hypothetical protein